MIALNVCNAALRTIGPHERHIGYFDLHGQAVRVTGPASGGMENLRSFFYPYIISRDETYCVNSFYDLTAVFEPKLYDYIKENIPESPDEVLTTALKHDLEYELGCYYSDSREISIIEDEPLKLFYLVSARGRVTKIIATTGSRTRTGLLRIIRGAWVLSHDALIVHGCVLGKNGRGIIIAGEKHAGKTTSLLNLCSRRHYDIVANDRLLLVSGQSDGRAHAIGVPTVINLRRDTVKPFPELQHLIAAPLFGVSDLARALNVDVRREVEITAVVFLSYEAGCRELVFRSLSQQESYEMLASHLFPPREYDWVRMMKIVEAAPDRVSLAKRDILNGIHCFQLSSNETQLEESATLLDEWCQRGSGRG